MRSTQAYWLGAAAAFLLASPAWAADASAGRKLFGQQCALCHSAAEGDEGIGALEAKTTEPASPGDDEPDGAIAT